MTRRYQYEITVTFDGRETLAMIVSLGFSLQKGFSQPDYASSESISNFLIGNTLFFRVPEAWY